LISSLETPHHTPSNNHLRINSFFRSGDNLSWQFDWFRENQKYSSIFGNLSDIALSWDNNLREPIFFTSHKSGFCSKFFGSKKFFLLFGRKTQFWNLSTGDLAAKKCVRNFMILLLFRCDFYSKDIEMSFVSVISVTLFGNKFTYHMSKYLFYYSKPALSNPVAIRHMWRQVLLMWRQVQFLQFHYLDSFD